MAEMTYKYNPEAIIAGIEDIRAAHNKIDGSLDQLETYATSQMNLWEGGARTQYQEHKKQWDQSVDNMKQIMTQNAIPALQRILENYNSTEKLNTQGWQAG